MLKHLDAENFVDALEKISLGEMEMLPPFTSREERLRQDIERLEATYDRLKSVIEGLTEEQLARPVTPPNPLNSFPGLTMLELVERSAGHAGTHARQVELTRKYVAEFNAREKAVTVLALGNGDMDAVPLRVKELIAFADYTAGDAPALDLARPWIRGWKRHPPRQPGRGGIAHGPGGPRRPMDGHLRDRGQPGGRPPGADGPGPPPLREGGSGLERRP